MELLSIVYSRNLEVNLVIVIVTGNCQEKVKRIFDWNPCWRGLRVLHHGATSSAIIPCS